MKPNSDYITLDKIWRQTISSLPVTDNIGEFFLVKFLLQHQDEIPLNEILVSSHPLEGTVGWRFPFVFAYEYPLDLDQSNLGKIDLILVKPALDPLPFQFLIIEFKYLTLASGKTARTRRTKSRNKVIEQALLYTSRFQRRFPTALVYTATVTNDTFLRNWAMHQKLKTFFQVQRALVLQQYPEYMV